MMLRWSVSSRYISLPYPRHPSDAMSLDTRDQAAWPLRRQDRSSPCPRSLSTTASLYRSHTPASGARRRLPAPPHALLENGLPSDIPPPSTLSFLLYHA